MFTYFYRQVLFIISLFKFNFKNFVSLIYYLLNIWMLIVLLFFDIKSPLETHWRHHFLLLNLFVVLFYCSALFFWKPFCYLMTFTLFFALFWFAFLPLFLLFFLFSFLLLSFFWNSHLVRNALFKNPFFNLKISKAIIWKLYKNYWILGWRGICKLQDINDDVGDGIIVINDFKPIGSREEIL